MALLRLLLYVHTQGTSGPIFGRCPVDRDWMKERSKNPRTGNDWVHAPPQAPKHLDDTDDVMKHLAWKKIDAFAGIGHGFYFWTGAFVVRAILSVFYSMSLLPSFSSLIYIFSSPCFPAISSENGFV